MTKQEERRRERIEEVRDYLRKNKDKKKVIFHFCLKWGASTFIVREYIKIAEMGL